MVEKEEPHPRCASAVANTISNGNADEPLD